MKRRYVIDMFLFKGRTVNTIIPTSYPDCPLKGHKRSIGSHKLIVSLSLTFFPSKSQNMNINIEL